MISVPVRWGAILFYYAVFSVKKVLVFNQAQQEAGNTKHYKEDTPMCFGEDPVIVNIISILRGKSPEDLRLIYQIVTRL